MATRSPDRRIADREPRLHVLLVSIVDPTSARNGAATVTRGWLSVLRAPPLCASVTCVAVEPLSRDRHRARQIVSAARALVTGLPAKAAFTRRRALRRAVAEQLARRRVDLVLLNGSDLLWLLPDLPRALPRALVAHNVEHRLFADQARIAARRRPWLAPLLERERRRLEAFESAGVRAVQHVALLSERDRRWAAELARHTVVVPPIFPPPSRPGPLACDGSVRPWRVGFVGSMEWWPNRAGLRWLLAEIWPRVTGSGIELHLFGKGTESVARPAGVVAHGEVSDVAEALLACDAMVSPGFVGGGVSVKLAEAVHHGIPTIACTFAANGLGLVENPLLAISDDPDAWVRWLLDGPARTQARTSPASARFSIDAHAEAIVAFVRHAAHDRL